ncbi:hypothetical protein LTR08_002800 [Meristemomyces frigidus]|nr:hypothetical protein LTR08_002800 [Meristemomyces frigidus]
MDISFGHDDAADTKLAFRPQPTTNVVEKVTAWVGDDGEQPRECEDESFHVPVPVSSDGPTTFSYQLALRNRLPNAKLVRHGDYDTSNYKPTFVHDCMMLPGSLANLISKGSSEDIVPRMTPGLLLGFHPFVHAETQLPCILQSPDVKDYVQGMVIFGQGKRARRIIHGHYSANARRVTVDIEIDVGVPVSTSERDFPGERWRFKRRTVSAHAWIWSNVGSGDVHFRTRTPRWTLEDYISGKLAPTQAMRTVDAGWLEDDISISGSDVDAHQELREVVRGGGGSLDYQRGAGFTGW